MAQSRGTKPQTHENQIYLTAKHELVSRVREIGSLNELICHIVLDHGFESYNKARDVARHHLLLHAKMGTTKELR